ncbi:hypothetical protein C922_03884 [Plasmodium inui San Antonio 1]|uniref:G domain-containing protein n=1 Tax=Plasmodium inui San Antonio 1 TaxID=1237626 RepID=W7A2S2_9APIC|nr:hypothetical protein C922_03884 [Plasmodium inui San Antonio 1]EUD65638.1 hypothetical protein C922_03884 [Plasmodium inui San Antonio 1]
MPAPGVVRNVCFRISIVGAANSGKSSLHNRLMRRLSANYKPSLVHQEPNYSIDTNESPFRVENTKCVIADTLGMNEQMMRRMQLLKHSKYEGHVQCNNLISQYLHGIRSSHLIFFCVKCSQVRESDILAYQIVRDIFTQSENLITVLVDESILRNGGGGVEDDVGTSQGRYNFLHAFEYFSNVVFFPNGLVWQDQGEDLVDLIRRKVREEVSRQLDEGDTHAGVDHKEAPIDEDATVEHPPGDPTNNYTNDEVRDLVDESLRIFRPKLSEETRNYFYKYVDLRKKEKSDERLFNDFLSERVLGKSLKRLTRGELLARGGEAGSEEEEAAVNTTSSTPANTPANTASNNAVHGGAPLRDYFDKMQGDFERKRTVAAKVKNKRMRLLRAIVGGQGGVNPYELLKLTGAGEATPVGEVTVGEVTVGEVAVGEVTDVEAANHIGAANHVEAATPKGGATPEEAHTHLQVCFLGERNSGKTTLIEAILRRPIVRDQDVMELFGRKKYINKDLIIQHKNVQITVADTCSLTKQHRFKGEDTYHDEEKQVFTNVERSDLCVYVKEAKENTISVSKEDKKMMFYLLRKKKNIIVVVTKIDTILTKFEEKKNEFLSSFSSFFNDIPVVFLNPNNQMHVQTLLNRMVHVHKMSHIRIPTSTLNLFLIRFLQLFPVPWVRKKKCHFKYIRQVNTNPVTFLVFTNLYQNIPNNYLSFFKKKLKDEFHLRSVNIQFIFRTTCDNANARRSRFVRAGGKAT